MTITGCIVATIFIIAFAVLYVVAAKTAEDPDCGVAPPFGAADPTKHPSQRRRPPPAAGVATRTRGRAGAPSSQDAPAPSPTDVAT